MVIYDKEGLVLLDIEVDDASVRYKAIKGENSLTLKFSLAEHVEVPIGSYCVFKDEVYTLMLPEDLTLNHRRSFEYSLVMYSEDAKSKRYMFVNPVDGRLKFSLTAKPVEHLQMFVDNMNMRDGGWEVGECVDHVEIVLSYNHTSCYDALVQLAEQMKVDYWFTGKKVSIGKLELNRENPLPLSYGGDGEGLKPNVKRTNYTDALPLEVLYVQGGEVNIDPSKYGASELHLPKSATIGYDGTCFDDEAGFDASKARYYKTDSRGFYVTRADKEILNHSEDSLDCSEIEPTKVEKVQSVVTVNAEKHFYDILFESDVDYSKYVIGGENAYVVFQSGMLAGKEFDLATNDAGNLICKKDGEFWRVEIVPQDIDGITMPDDESGYMPVKDNEFKVFGIQLPNEYIADAELEMLKYAVKYFYANEDVQYSISGEMDEIYAKENWDSIKNKIVLGGYVSFSDRSFQDEPLLIRITGIKEYVNKPYSPVLEISNAALSSSLIGSLNRMENQEVETDAKFKEIRNFTKRRFSSALETIEMLKEAFKDFSAGIDPVTVQTMALLVGDESLQFKFIGAGTSGSSVNPGFSFNATTKQFKVNRNARLMHMTLGINEVTSKDGRTLESYLKWTMPSWTSLVLSDAEKSYYLYARVPKDGTTGEYLLSESAKGMESESGYYHLLVGILNTEYQGNREFVPLYGFTEVLPGRITTDLIRSTDGETYFDLERGEIGGTIHLKAGSKGLENIIDEVTIGGQNLLRNSGFTGDYLSERLADEIVLDATSQMENNPLAYWDGSTNVNVSADSNSASGYSATIAAGTLRQTLQTPTIGNENYVFTVKAKGNADMTLKVGGNTYSFAVASASGHDKYKVSLMASVSSSDFSLATEGNVSVCELQLERGTVATSWSNSPFDNSSDRSYYQALKYLSDAIKGTTVIDGGLVLTSLLKLGNYSNDSAFVENAGVSGSFTDADSPAFWAGGTMEQAIELLTRIHEGNSNLDGLADFVVTHGGMAVLRNLMLFANSGKVGGLNITEAGLEVATKQGGKVVISDGGVILYGRGGNISGSLGYCGGSAVSAIGVGGIEACPSDEEQTGLYASSGKSAFFCNRGRFVGLRTATKVIDSAGSESRNRLTEMDYNVLVTLSDRICYFSILNTYGSMEDGQEYIIESMGASLNIVTGSNNIYDMFTGVKKGSNATPLTHDGRGVIRLKYYKGADTWTCASLTD